MSWFYRLCIRPALFDHDGERVHDFILKLLSAASRNRAARGAIGRLFSAQELPVEVFGLKFPNPLGLAAGMDKFAAAVPIWEKMGFGFCELGAVTHRPQPGNPRPRMFRAAAAGAIVNRMGFNNSGAKAMAGQLLAWKDAGRWPRHPVGINLGKSQMTPLKDAAEDYAASFRILRGLADFFVINVSSPNTPGLLQLQETEPLNEILSAIEQAQGSATFPVASIGVSSTAPSAQGNHKPILLKISPDLSLAALDKILELAIARRVSGIVATNTTTLRPEASDSRIKKFYSEAGGLSGRPLRAISTTMIRHIFKQTRGQLPIVGVGGIFSVADALEKIEAGATLVQIYTGLVFEGPGLPKQIVTGLIQQMNHRHISKFTETVGSPS